MTTVVPIESHSRDKKGSQSRLSDATPSKKSVITLIRDSVVQIVKDLPDEGRNEWLDYFNLFLTLTSILSGLCLAWSYYYLRSDPLIEATFVHLILHNTTQHELPFRYIFHACRYLASYGSILMIFIGKKSKDPTETEEIKKVTSNSDESSTPKFNSFQNFFMNLIAYGAIISQVAIICALFYLAINFTFLNPIPNIDTSSPYVDSMTGSQKINYLETIDDIADAVEVPDTSCDLNLGIIGCKLKYKNATAQFNCERTCCLFALEQENECCGLGVNFYGKYGLTPSATCKNPGTACDTALKQFGGSLVSFTLASSIVNIIFHTLLIQVRNCLNGGGSKAKELEEKSE